MRAGFIGSIALTVAVGLSCAGCSGHSGEQHGHSILRVMKDRGALIVLVPNGTQCRAIKLDDELSPRAFRKEHVVWHVYDACPSEEYTDVRLVWAKDNSNYETPDDQGNPDTSGSFSNAVAKLRLTVKDFPDGDLPNDGYWLFGYRVEARQAGNWVTLGDPKFEVDP